MIDLLTPARAALIAGVPPIQLLRWAYLHAGPPNRGTAYKPLYDEDDLRKWRAGYDRIRHGEVEWHG